MAEAKKINLSKFFRQDSASPSGVRVRDEMGIIPQAQIVMSGKDLSEIVKIIESSTEITSYQKEYIEVEDRNDSLLQTSVSSLQQRIFGLQTSLSDLQLQFQQDLLSRQREFQKSKRDALVERAEASKVSGTIEPRQRLVGAEPESYENTEDESDAGGIAAALAGLAGGITAALTPMGGDDESSGGGTSTSGAGVWKPLLDLIASGEGSWESLNPSTTLPGATKMSIDEVARKAGDTGDGKNRAVGRYQFTTLRSQATAAGLNPEKDIFTPENQDKIAVHILENKRRGKDWLSGKITDEEFSEELSNEWGALKSAKGNVLPGNSGKIGFDQIKPTLQQIKKSEVSAPQSSTISSASTPAADSDPMTSKGSGSQISAVSSGGDSSQGLAPPPNLMSSAAPIVIPINKKEPAVMQTDVSAGSAIPGGLTENLNNFYPMIAKSILGIV